VSGLKQRLFLGIAKVVHMEARAEGFVERWRVARARRHMWMSLAGINSGILWQTLREWPKFKSDAARFRQLSGEDEAFVITRKNFLPILGENHQAAGSGAGHYFHQDLWAARKIHERAPTEHFDVGSRIDGFVAHVLTFMPVTVIDIRPMSEPIEGLRFIQDDATDLSTIADGSLGSVSSLHAVEHFGLGRYGDEVDPTAAVRAMAALARVLRSGGRLYFSVPIGRERLMFNAHRIFSPDTVLRAFSDLQLMSFAAVDDSGHLVSEACPDDFLAANYSCGLFEFTKV
jgi:SAM-dependent methyltransferase